VSKSSYGFFMGSTEISVDKTVGEIVTVLRRIRALQIGFRYKGDKLDAVQFSLALPGFPAPVSFELPARVEPLFERMKKKGMHDRQQAERVAWRQVLRWVEAQTAMIDVGMVESGEVFMPYAITPSGRTIYQLFVEGGAKMLAAAEGSR
jgi:hypothetical protein